MASEFEILAFQDLIIYQLDRYEEGFWGFRSRESDGIRGSHQDQSYASPKITVPSDLVTQTKPREHSAKKRLDGEVCGVQSASNKTLIPFKWAECGWKDLISNKSCR